MKTVAACRAFTRLMPAASFLLLAAASSVCAVPLYSESFDSAATARVKVNQQTNTTVTYVDYSSFVRNEPSGGSAVTIRIPEAPNRIPGSAPTRGVVLSALYNGTARGVNLIAADAPNGNAVSFPPAAPASQNYRMTYDLWLSVDPAATPSSSGTTEAAVWGIGSSGSSVLTRALRTSGTGTWGWLTTEGGAGAGAGAGDASFYINGIETLKREDVNDAGLFASAFFQGSPITEVPNNHWTAVDISVIDDRVIVKMNGAVFFDQVSSAVSGQALVGYDDIFNTAGSVSFSRNWQFGLIDNFVIESIPDVPSLALIPVVNATVVSEDAAQSSIEAGVVNNGTADFNVLTASIDGVAAADFVVNTTLPAAVPVGTQLPIPVTFTPTAPNGLKVARLTLTTDDPNAPLLTIPLQGRRQVSTLIPQFTATVPTVFVQNGTSTGILTLTNSSPVSTTISSITVTGANAAEFTHNTVLPLQIPSGESRTVDVVFAPTGARGVRSASLDIVSNDTGNPLLSVTVRARYTWGTPLLAHYKMDDTAGTTLSDSSGNAFNAGLQIREAPFEFSLASLLPNAAGTACGFKPANSSTTGNYAAASVPHLPTVSYSLWIRPQASPAGNRMLLHRSSVFSLNGTIHSLVLTPAGRLVFNLNSAEAVATEDGAILDGEVYHIVVVQADSDGFSNTTADATRLYVNGTLISEKLAPDSAGHTDYLLTPTVDTLHIASATAAGAGYMGQIDDLQIYSVALTQEQITGIYSQPGRHAFNLLTSPLAVTGFSWNPQASSISLSWSSEAGAVYAIEESVNLTQWTDVAGQTGIASGGATTSTTITGVSAADRKFYRAKRTSPQ